MIFSTFLSMIWSGIYIRPVPNGGKADQMRQWQKCSALEGTIPNLTQNACVDTVHRGYSLLDGQYDQYRVFPY